MVVVAANAVATEAEVAEVAKVAKVCCMYFLSCSLPSTVFCLYSALCLTSVSTYITFSTHYAVRLLYYWLAPSILGIVVVQRMIHLHSQ